MISRPRPFRPATFTRASRALVALTFTVGVTAATASCSQALDKVDATPKFEPEGQTKCSIAKSQSRPLIVEWPSAERAALEVQVAGGRGLVAVTYSGCEMHVLRGCSAKGSYGYTPFTRKRDRVKIRNADDLYANVPLGAAKLEGTLKAAGELNVAMTLIGQFSADHVTFAEADLEGACADATHVITAATAGAFEFFAGSDVEAGAEASGLGAKAGGNSSAKKETITEDGKDADCNSKSDDKVPPAGCGALLRIEVSPIARAAKAKAPTDSSQLARERERERERAAAAAAGGPNASRDRDGDGVADSEDACPDVPGTANRDAKARGCPADADRDGVPDSSDACMTEPGVASGDPRQNGCPAARDRDGDGIPDATDRCPNAPEDHDGFEDDDGCPDPDNDNDGILDTHDKCPNHPETMNGLQDDDGCPDEKLKSLQPSGGLKRKN